MCQGPGFSSQTHKSHQANKCQKSGSCLRWLNSTLPVLGSEDPHLRVACLPCWLTWLPSYWMNGITNASWHESIICASTPTKRPATSNEACSACFLHRLSDSLDMLSEISSNKQNHSYPGKMVVFKFSLKYFFTFTHWSVFLLFSIRISIFLWMTVWNASA